MRGLVIIRFSQRLQSRHGCRRFEVEMLGKGIGQDRKRFTFQHDFLVLHELFDKLRRTLFRFAGTQNFLNRSALLGITLLSKSSLRLRGFARAFL